MATHDFSQMPQVMSRCAEKIVRNVEALHKEAHIEGLRATVEKTPVDTGLARSNWISTINAPAPFTLPTPYAPGSRLGVGEGGNRAGAILQGVRLMAHFKMPQMTKTFITNSISYIVPINFRSSSPFFFQAGINAVFSFLLSQTGRPLKDVDKV